MYAESGKNIKSLLFAIIENFFLKSKINSKILEFNLKQPLKLFSKFYNDIYE